MHMRWLRHAGGGCRAVCTLSGTSSGGTSGHGAQMCLRWSDGVGGRTCRSSSATHAASSLGIFLLAGVRWSWHRVALCSQPEREREREREHLFKRETEHLLPNRRRTLLSAGKTAVFPHLIIAPMPTRLSTYGADRGITRGSTSAVVGGWMQHPPHVFTVCSQCVHCVRLQTNTQHRVHRMVHVQQTRSRVDSMAT